MHRTFEQSKTLESLTLEATKLVLGFVGAKAAAYSAAELYPFILELRKVQPQIQAADNARRAEVAKNTYIDGKLNLFVKWPDPVLFKSVNAAEDAAGISELPNHLLDSINTLVKTFENHLDWIALPVLETKTGKLFKPNRNAVKYLENLKLTGEVTKVRTGDPEVLKGMNTPAVFFMLDLNHVMRSKAVAKAFFGIAKGMLADTEWNSEALKCLQLDPEWLGSDWIKYVDQGKAFQQVLANFRRSDRSMKLVFEAKIVKGKQVINPIAVATKPTVTEEET
jgi:hypothetical protein